MPLILLGHPTGLQKSLPVLDSSGRPPVVPLDIQACNQRDLESYKIYPHVSSVLSESDWSNIRSFSGSKATGVRLEVRITQPRLHDKGWSNISKKKAFILLNIIRPKQCMIAYGWHCLCLSDCIWIMQILTCELFYSLLFFPTLYFITC